MKSNATATADNRSTDAETKEERRPNELSAVVLVTMLGDYDTASTSIQSRKTEKALAITKVACKGVIGKESWLVDVAKEIPLASD